MQRKIEVYNGPTKEFKHFFQSSDHILFLHSLVASIDKENINTWINETSGKNYILVCYSEELLSVNEHFLGVLPHLIKVLMERECISECYIQNPQKTLKEGIIREFNNSEKYLLKITNFEFRTIDEGDITTLFKTFDDEIVGQQSALTEILSTIYPLTTKTYDKPIVMMFYGPAGVGKTETANFINKKLFGGNLFRQQLSMYRTTEFVSYLFGGKVNSNSFAKDLLERESNVILLDEFDKCPPDFHSAFYQIFDEGIFVDKNYEVNLKGTIIICTTNYASPKQILEHMGGPIYSRFDHFIPFQNLTSEDKVKLITRIYEKYINIWSKEQRIILEEAKALEFLINNTERFTNVRNIDNGIRAYMSKILLDNLLQSTASN